MRYASASRAVLGGLGGLGWCVDMGAKMGAGVSLTTTDWRTEYLHSAPEMTTTPHQHMAQKHTLRSKFTSHYHPFRSAILTTPHFPLSDCRHYSVHSHVDACRKFNSDLHSYYVLSPSSLPEHCRGLLVINRSGMLPQSLPAIPQMAIHSLCVSYFQLAKSLAELALRSAFH